MSYACLAGVPIDLDKALISVISITLSIIFLLILRNQKTSIKSKIFLIYGHLTTLFFPFILFTINIGCGAFCLSCYNNIFSLIIYSIPTTLFISTIAGFIFVPIYYIYTNKSREIKNKALTHFLKKHCKKLNITIPKIYVLDKPNPMAFSLRSFKSSIFLSVGLFDILKIREIEAVILHELYHIASKSSILKFSHYILQFFSPLSFIAKLSHDSNEEEQRADKFVIEIQKTNKYIISAKRKIMKFNF
ncbi:MAG: M48 family metalloprotease [Candidatus Aenigmatarchaeota archaeon]